MRISSNCKLLLGKQSKQKYKKTTDINKNMFVLVWIKEFFTWFLNILSVYCETNLALGDNKVEVEVEGEL